MAKKIISIALIVSFLCYFDGLLFSRASDEVMRQFEKARARFVNGQYVDARNRLERLTAIIHEKGLDRENVLGKCFLLLGAIYEKEEKKQMAEENYAKARDIYDVRTVEGVNLEDLLIYRRVVKGEIPDTAGLIEKDGKLRVRKKRKFPWLLVLGGVAVTAVVVILLTKKKKEEINEFSITVNRGEGVEGNPSSGTYTYAEGTRVDYAYSAEAGYGGLQVKLDGSDVTPTGSFVVSGDHSLTAAASVNQVGFETNTNNVQIDEGGTAFFDVRLTAQPQTGVQATVARVSGDTDISVTGGTSLTFTDGNWASYQRVTLAAGLDSDTDNGSAVVRISAAGLANKDITVTENDQNTLGFETDVNQVSVAEGGTGQFRVRLSAQPSADVSATVSRESGDTDITVTSGASLTFTPANWSDYQTVTLSAAEDTDALNGQAVLRISADALQTRGVTAVEVDNDTLQFITDTESLTVNEGSQTTFRLKLSAAPSGDLSVSVARASGDPDISVQGSSTLVFSSANWDNYQMVTVAAAEDADTSDGQAVVRVSASGVPDKDITVDEVDNDSLSIVTDTDSVTVLEAATASFQVKLSAQPTSNVTLSVARRSGDTDISVTGGGTLVFTSVNWDDYQAVTLTAARDDDGANGQAVIRVQGDGVSSKDVTAVESDTGLGNPPTVSINSPGAGDTVEDDVNITAVAGDDFGIQKVEFYIDNVFAAEDTTYPYMYTWSTQNVAVGDHQIRAVAYDWGDQTDEESITVTVGDSLPTVSFNSVPASPLSGTVSITVGAQDYRGVQTIQFYVGGTLVQTWDSGPDTDVGWSFDLDTTAYTNGDYTLSVVATDTGGQDSAAAESTVTITN